jgi:hypothetical protein
MGCLEINELVLVKVYLSFCNYYYCLKLRLGWTSGCSIVHTNFRDIFDKHQSPNQISFISIVFVFFSRVILSIEK